MRAGQLLRLDPDVTAHHVPLRDGDGARAGAAPAHPQCDPQGTRAAGRAGSSLVLDAGTRRDRVRTRCYVDCSADGLERRPVVPIFATDRITLQSVRTCQQVFSAAFIASRRSSVRQTTARRTRSAPSSRTPTTTSTSCAPHSPMRSTRQAGPRTRNSSAWLQDASRLDGFKRVSSRGRARSDAETQALEKKLQENAHARRGEAAEVPRRGRGREGRIARLRPDASGNISRRGRSTRDDPRAARRRRERGARVVQRNTGHRSSRSQASSTPTRRSPLLARRAIRESFISCCAGATSASRRAFASLAPTAPSTCLCSENRIPTRAPCSQSWILRRARDVRGSTPG